MRGGDAVFRLHRVRAHEGRLFMIEDSTVPQARFPGLAQELEIPSSIVVLSHRYGVLLARAEERISVTAADHSAAEALSIADGTPLLKLDAVVYAIDGRPIEWRIARCDLGDMYYMTEIH
jgi:GntR family transcriptional regulator